MINANWLLMKVHRKYFLRTYVAPMVFNFRNCGVNWYRTYRPAFVSIMLVSSVAFDITSSLAVGALVVSSTLPSGNCSLGGFAISNRTVPLSRSRILKRVKSMSYTFASVVSNPCWFPRSKHRHCFSTMSDAPKSWKKK